VSLRAVWVYPKGQGRRILPVGPEKWASTEELHRLAEDPDPEVRARAFETLVGRKGGKAQEVVFDALGDPNDRVRFRTLQAALNNRVPLALDSLQYLVQNDSSPVVRFLALSGMAENSEVGSNNLRALAESVLNDPNPQVREQAREILDQLNPSEQTQETSQGQGSPQ
jgi:HEAT repeat protein